MANLFWKQQGKKTFAFFFKLPKSVAEKIRPEGLKMDRYEDQWKEAVYKIYPIKTKVKTFLPLFEKAVVCNYLVCYLGTFPGLSVISKLQL